MSSKFVAWMDERFPLTKVWNEHLAQYYAPKNFNFLYYFGVIATVVLVIQLVSGIFLTMNFVPDSRLAFSSVEYIMRDVPFGWLIRYIHSTGASAFFIVIYLHMFRGLIYGSFRKPRELVWILGMIIFVALMAEAFMGYLLPWGNMSYWGAQVIISLFGAFGSVGEALAQWLRGDYVVSGATLNRFFAFHVIAVPLILVALVFVHIVALHAVGSNNPDGIEIKKHKGADGVPLDGIPFHPYYIVKDTFGVAVFFILFCIVIFYMPEFGGYFLEPANFEPANTLQTPPHIAPLWYFGPFYSILRANTGSELFSLFHPAKLWGVIMMGGAIVVLFFLPWLDRSPVKSIRYKGVFYKTMIIVFAVNFIILGWLAFKPAEPPYVIIAQICTIIYFAFFALLPFYHLFDKTKPVPERVR